MGNQDQTRVNQNNCCVYKVKELMQEDEGKRLHGYIRGGGLDKNNIKMDPKETRFVHVTDVIWLRIGPNKHDSELSVS